MNRNVLIIEPQSILADVLRKTCVDMTIVHAHDAKSAIQKAAEIGIDAVVTELSLSGHSGFEFLYEFRSYADWQDIPVIVYSGVRLSDEVLQSRSWHELVIYAYVYKPTTTLHALKSTLEKAVTLGESKT